MAPSALANPARWFYHAFGIDAIHKTGRNAYLIIISRTCRMLAYGAGNLVLALFFAALDFSDYQIGLFMTLTLFGEVVLGGFLTMIADRVGRRKILLAGSLLMVMSGAIFALVDNFWVLLFAAVVGVISATGADFGPFRAIEESMLSHLTTPQTRADVLAWYITISSLGSGCGAELGGRFVHVMEKREGWNVADAYHAMFWIYSVMGVVNAAFTFALTEECEISKQSTPYSQVRQDEGDENEPVQTSGMHHAQSTEQPSRPWYSRLLRRVGTLLSQISKPTRSIMYKLWILLAMDSLADGMVPYSLTNYYIDNKFHPAKSTLGDIVFAAYMLSSTSTVFAGPLARKIGLINTMVFTHIPSSAAVLIFPVAGSFPMAVILLLIRAALNMMDQAPRAAFIAGVVKPEERTGVMGITSMLRTLASTLGPSVTGILAGSDKFWIAFVAAGALRLAYDIGLYVLFINTKLHQHEPGHEETSVATPLSASSEELVGTEMDKLSPPKGLSPTTRRTSFDGRESSGLIPQNDPSVRRRSPSPAFREAAP